MSRNPLSGNRLSHHSQCHDPEQPTAVMLRAIACHPEVERGIVVSGPEIVAVVVARDVCRALDIRDELGAVARQAGYDVEPTLLVVSTLPEDEAALRQELSTSTSLYRYEAPATPLEATVADLLARALNRPRVGVLDDFTDLGGDSLTAITVVDSVHRELGVELTLVDLFAAMTVRTMARLLESRAPNPDGTPVNA